MADRHYNLIFGENASGKTSLLEAIAYLGRGKSFRSSATQDVIKHGAHELLLLGKVGRGGREATVGVRNSKEGLEIRVDGESAGTAKLAEALPLQIVDPDVHELVSGNPEVRRRYLDWIAFHVEPGYLAVWRRFRRALKQRNAALKEGASEAVLDSWDREFLESASLVHQFRVQITGLCAMVFEEVAEDLLEHSAAVEYRQGWASDSALDAALSKNRARDREYGTTHAGPHRADLKLALDDRMARKIVSRGQQKLLACALILTATELVQSETERPLLLLLDDPAAELDASSLGRLMARVINLGCQVVATALEPDSRLFPSAPALFHVERGTLMKAEG